MSLAYPAFPFLSIKWIKSSLRNAEKLIGDIHCYVEWVEPMTPRQVISPSILAVAIK
jgi:hypothetical protein